jgi:tetratricopeptide (TPR) repeat protein
MVLDRASAGVCRAVLPPPVDEAAVTLKLRRLRWRDRHPVLAQWPVTAIAAMVTVAAMTVHFVDTSEAESAEPAAARIVAVARPIADVEPVLASGALPTLEPLEDIVIVEDVDDEIVIFDEPVEPPPAKTTPTPRRSRARGVARMHMGKGETARSVGDLGVAKREFEAALIALPAYAPAAAALARLHMKQRSYGSALRYAKRAFRSAPRKLDYVLLLGDAYSVSGNRAAAKNLWRRAAAYGSAKAKSRLAS